MPEFFYQSANNRHHFVSLRHFFPHHFLETQGLIFFQVIALS